MRRHMSERPSQEAIKRTRLSLAIIVVLYCLYVVSLNFLASDRVRLRVETVSAAEYCRKTMGRRSRIEKSLHPRSVVECGDVITDKGQFLLPRTKLHWFDLQLKTSIFDSPRAKLFETLTPGCRYEVKIVGWGSAYKRRHNKRPAVSNRVNHRISRIYAELGCD